MDRRIYIKKMALLVIIGVVIVTGEIAALAWLKGRIDARVRTIRAAQSLLVEQERAQNEFASLIRDYERVKHVLARLESALPKVDDLFGLIGEMNRIAERAGNRQTIAIESQSPLQSDIPGVFYVVFGGDVEGTFSTLRHYLNELGRAPFFAIVDTVNMNSPTTIASGIKARISGKIYLR